MYRQIYRNGLTLEQARDAIDALAAEHPEAREDVAMMQAFLQGSTRGITR